MKNVNFNADWMAGVLDWLMDELLENFLEIIEKYFYQRFFHKDFFFSLKKISKINFLHNLQKTAP